MTLPSAASMIAIGASTGGIEALQVLMPYLKSPMPPILIVQHIQPNFAAKMIARLSQHTELDVITAPHKSFLKNDTIYVSPGGKHVIVNTQKQVELDDSAPVLKHKPSVDTMMQSVAESIGRSAIGIVLTGMGNDGYMGILAMKQVGCYTVGQDEESCVVYGMPRAAKAAGGISKELPLKEIGQWLKGVEPL